MATPITLGKLQRVPLRDAWRHEEGEFTPWLSRQENLSSLADALGFSELQLVKTEDFVGDFRLDLLCTDGDDQVIIENQLAESDHKHLGQTLVYAAGVGAKRVVWITESFRSEHRAALEFLNEHTTEDLAFFGVQIELWRIDGSPPALKFEVVVKPNEWARSRREQARAASTSSRTKQLQLRFWTRLISDLARSAPNIRPQKPGPQHWLTTSIGHSGFKLNVTANTRDGRLGVELYLKDAEAKRRFSELLSMKNDIEGQLGFALDWQELPEATACRIEVRRDDSSIEDESRWDEYCDWIGQRLVQMDRVFRPIVKGLE